jgi:hypothetical protein
MTPPTEDDMVKTMLQVLAFADDTTGITCARYQEDVERLIIDILARHGMKAHPGKLERLIAGSPPDDLDGKWSKAVRYLGILVDMDGSTASDTAARLRAARAVSRKLWKQLPKLGL